ncbi:patatin-like phospholipase family protein [candidate division TA06 bacterium]|nr:patatin-like phospholipase family protein [candidate division TA06 bacterium]
MATKRALVMSGGGAKGAFELGAVDTLVRDLNLEFDVIAGSSTGTLNAAMLAQGKGREGLLESLQKLKDLWFGIRSHKDIY